MDMKAVRVGQRWRHRSGDERIVRAILTYKQRTGFDPYAHQVASGITHIAAMFRDDGLGDRRDSSDMELIHFDGEFYAAFPSSWTLLHGTDDAERGR